MDIALALAAVAVPLWLNVHATRLVLRDGLSGRRQKTGQLVLVWLVPVIGAVIVLAVHRGAETPTRQYRKDADPGEDFGYSGAASRKAREVLDDHD